MTPLPKLNPIQLYRSRIPLRSEGSIRFDVYHGVHDTETLPCFWCGKLPSFEWSKRQGKIYYSVKHTCDQDRKRYPHAFYSVSPRMSSNFDLVRELWNEQQRQLKITTDYAAKHPEIFGVNKS